MLRKVFDSVFITVCIVVLVFYTDIPDIHSITKYTAIHYSPSQHIQHHAGDDEKETNHDGTDSVGDDSEDINNDGIDTVGDDDEDNNNDGIYSDGDGYERTNNVGTASVDEDEKHNNDDIDSADDDDSYDIFEERIRKVRSVCAAEASNTSSPSPVNPVKPIIWSLEEKHNLLMCRTAKHGSTTWASIFVKIYTKGSVLAV